MPLPSENENINDDNDDSEVNNLPFLTLTRQPRYRPNLPKSRASCKPLSYSFFSYNNRKDDPEEQQSLVAVKGY